MGYDDVKKVGRSKRVPYIYGETAQHRHVRRKLAAENDLKHLRGWCLNNDWSLTLHNDGQHWRMVGHGHTADWYPSSAKLIIDQQCQKGIHCHDFRQVIWQLKEVMRE